MEWLTHYLLKEHIKGKKIVVWATGEDAAKLSLMHASVVNEDVLPYAIVAGVPEKPSPKMRRC